MTATHAGMSTSSQTIRTRITSSEHRPDPNGILAFLVDVLQATEDAGQRAWIIGHVPPGHVDTMHDQVSFDEHQSFESFVWPTYFLTQSNHYNQVIQRYNNSIAGQFFGHSHHVCNIVSYTCEALPHSHDFRINSKLHI
jgi:hypothetical protein